MVSRPKLYARLDSLEAELEERLVPHLQQAAIGMNDLVFCAEGYNPFPQSKHGIDYSPDKLTEELIGLGTQILSLRAKLSEPSENTIAERICWYCNKWGNTCNQHRGAAQALAKQFLSEIEQE